MPRKILFYFFLAPTLLVLLATAATFVVAQVGSHEHKSTIVINASREDVWQYMSENHHAKMWSVFFDHITTLESDDPAIQEGGIGSVRRCFRHADEKGISWDEVTVKVEPYQFRQIHTYNIQNWPYEDFNALEFNVYQYYESISDSQTRLSFATDLKTPMTAYAKWMFYTAKWETGRIFTTNLENIKAHIEQGAQDSYVRPHAWEETTAFEKILSWVD